MPTARSRQVPPQEGSVVSPLSRDQAIDPIETDFPKASPRKGWGSGGLAAKSAIQLELFP